MHDTLWRGCISIVCAGVRLGSKGFWIFVAAWAIYSVCPPFTSYDSYWTVPVALNILDQGRTDVDRFIAAAPPLARTSAECVPAGRSAILFTLSEGCPDGHAYNYFPLAVSVLALPVIVILKGAAGISSALLPRALFHQPVIASFFSGDLVQGHALAELWTASLFGAIAVWLQYRIYSRYLSASGAAWLAILFAFGTAEWSVASRSLLQHGSSVLLLSAAIYLLLKGLDQPRLAQFASMPIALSYTLRPSNAVAVAVVTIFVAIHRRRYLLRYFLWSLPVAIPFFAYNLFVRHSLLPLYFRTGPPFSSVWPGLAMQLFSPSRGLLIFTPVFVFSLIGMVTALRRRWMFPLAPYLVAVIVLHAIAVSLWWPGHCYGSRYFTDMNPLFMLFLIPAAAAWSGMRGSRRTVAASVFVLFALWGVFVHARGATSAAVHLWSAVPVNVDDAPSRVWDWSDPQFLRGLWP